MHSGKGTLALTKISSKNDKTGDQSYVIIGVMLQSSSFLLGHSSGCRSLGLTKQRAVRGITISGNYTLNSGVDQQKAQAEMDRDLGQLGAPSIQPEMPAGACRRAVHDSIGRVGAVRLLVLLGAVMFYC